MPGISSASGNMRPQSMAIRSSPDSMSIMLRPISPSPPRGIRRTEGSTKTPFVTAASSYHPPRGLPKFPGQPRHDHDDPQAHADPAHRSPSPREACSGRARAEVRAGAGGGAALKGCLRLELADHRVGSLEEPPALGGADRLARDEPLAQGVHELSVLRHPVVQVRPGGEPGRADPADDLALADSHATPHARVDLREVVVHRGVARAVAD